MPLKKKYKCENCGYEIDIYEGRGLFGQQIEVMFCPDCQTIQNIVYGGIIGEVAPSFSTAIGRLCLNCGSENIRKWDGHTCPKCEGKIKDTGNKEFWT